MTKHTWLLLPDGKKFICTKCGKEFDRGNSAVYPDEGEDCEIED